MKYIMLILVTLFSVCLLSANISLNKYGHIEGTNKETTAKYYIENGEYYININGYTLIGNSLFEIENGYLTLITIEENIPTWLRIYDINGNLKFKKTFRKVINLTVSENKKHSAFFDGKELVVLNSSTFKRKKYPASVIFNIDGNGVPIYADKNGGIHYRNVSYTLPEFPRKIILYNNEPLIFTSKNAYKIKEDLKKILSFSGNFFEAKIIDSSLYYVEKIRGNECFIFKLYKTDDFKNIEKLQENILEKNSSRTHEPIYSPLNYGVPNYPFPVGNSYGEIQQYGYNPYLHPGVDFLGDDFQEVFSVHDGYVKAVLTTGGDPYWRIAIANEDVSTETEGYLYAHLNEDSIVYTVGDSVLAGDFLGTLYPWGWYDFTHIHFARLQDEGTIWIGNWWTIDNPHVDVINIQDTIPPTFENAIDNDLFAFRTDSGTYLDPDNLFGEFDIIAKCHDIENSDWRIDVWDISFSLHPANNPDSTVYEQFSFAYDMPIDTYFSNYWTDIVLYTIYSRDATCYSIGNYDEREYYHIITNSNGDSLITEDDADEIFNSADFPDGDYYFKVTVRDASMNVTVDSMLVTFNNGISDVEDYQLPITNYQLNNYPNPFNPETTISFSLTTEFTENTELTIYNLKGQKIRKYSIFNNHSSIIWNGTDQNNQPVSSGVYLYKLHTGKNEITKKMLLLK